MVIVGTPDECLEKLRKDEEAGVDQLLCYLNFGYLPHQAVLKSIELLGTHVIPELKRRGAHRTAAGAERAIRQAAAVADA
jgi:alkanesulfonate monooxygenase SsuD/methylene tetrahydromethanopterin reductase-like flavin-dependent oxidoreductase (luciferase family)